MTARAGSPLFDFTDDGAEPQGFAFAGASGGALPEGDMAALLRYIPALYHEPGLYLPDTGEAGAGAWATATGDVLAGIAAQEIANSYLYAGRREGGAPVLRIEPDGSVRNLRNAAISLGHIVDIEVLESYEEGAPPAPLSFGAEATERGTGGGWGLGSIELERAPGNTPFDAAPFAPLSGGALHVELSDPLPGTEPLHVSVLDTPEAHADERVLPAASEAPALALALYAETGVAVAFDAGAAEGRLWHPAERSAWVDFAEAADEPESFEFVQIHAERLAVPEATPEFLPPDLPEPEVFVPVEEVAFDHLPDGDAFLLHHDADALF